jgi:hypothetical protein
VPVIRASGPAGNGGDSNASVTVPPGPGLNSSLRAPGLTGTWQAHSASVRRRAIDSDAHSDTHGLSFKVKFNPGNLKSGVRVGGSDLKFRPALRTSTSISDGAPEDFPGRRMACGTGQQEAGPTGSRNPLADAAWPRRMLSWDSVFTEGPGLRRLGLRVSGRSRAPFKLLTRSRGQKTLDTPLRLPVTGDRHYFFEKRV